MLGRISEKLDKRQSSPIFDSLSSAAIEFQILYLELDNLISNSYGDTASREFLILLCKDRGITPQSASKAILKGVFAPDTIDVTGKRFNIGELNYTVLEQTEPGEYKVQCDSAGVVGNQFLGQMIPMEYIAGLETAELTEVLIPGKDEEDTEDLRQRYFDSFKAQSFGGNMTDYITKVKEIDGVGGVKVTRLWNGDINPADMIPTAAVKAWYENIIGTLDENVATWLSAVYMASFEKKLTVGGTVLISIINSLDFSEASSTLVDNVQTMLDPEQNAGEGYGLAPIGHVVNVKSAETVALNITTEITFDAGYSWSNLQNAIQNAVEDYLLELRQTWADTDNIVVRISQIETRILALKGVVDITGTQINGNADNFTLAKFQIPVIGGVSDGSGS